MLPINDEAHVRNALARFSRVNFEDDASRDKARMRLLRAAKRLGILPLGFVGGQLRPERALPRGQVTLALIDIEGSTELLHRLGDGYGPVLNQVRRLLRTAVRRAGGREVDARGDELFAAFQRPASAVAAGLAIQREMLGHAWPDGVDVRVRIGLHTGRPTMAETGYIGLAVHTVARICTSGHGGQIVMSAATRDALDDQLPDDVAITTLGTWRLKGLRESVELLQVSAAGLPVGVPAASIGRPGPEEAAYDPSVGPNSRLSQLSSGVRRSTRSPSRRSAEPGASADRGGASGPRVKGVSLALPSP